MSFFANIINRIKGKKSSQKSSNSVEPTQISEPVQRGEPAQENNSVPLIKQSGHRLHLIGFKFDPRAWKENLSKLSGKIKKSIILALKTYIWLPIINSIKRFIFETIRFLTLLVEIVAPWRYKKDIAKGDATVGFYVFIFYFFVTTLTWILIWLGSLPFIVFLQKNRFLKAYGPLFDRIQLVLDRAAFTSLKYSYKDGLKIEMVQQPLWIYVYPYNPALGFSKYDFAKSKVYFGKNICLITTVSTTLSKLDKSRTYVILIDSKDRVKKIENIKYGFILKGDRLIRVVNTVYKTKIIKGEHQNSLMRWIPEFELSKKSLFDSIGLLKRIATNAKLEDIYQLYERLMREVLKFSPYIFGGLFFIFLGIVFLVFIITYPFLGGNLARIFLYTASYMFWNLMLGLFLNVLLTIGLLPWLGWTKLVIFLFNPIVAFALVLAITIVMSIDLSSEK